VIVIEGNTHFKFGGHTINEYQGTWISTDLILLYNNITSIYKVINKLHVDNQESIILLILLFHAKILNFKLI
jgi:hypothetical protein